MQTRRWLVVIFVCLGLFASLVAFKVTQIQAAIAFGKSFPEPAETVESGTVQSLPFPHTLTALGEVLPTQSLEVRNPLDGVITLTGFESGGNVSKGQLLVQLDITEEQAQLQAAQAQAQLVQVTLRRIEELQQSNAASKDQLDQVTAENAVIQAQIRALQARIDKKTIKAAFAGRASLHRLEIGQYLAPNTVITTLVGSNSSVWVDFQLPQQQATLKTGDKIQIRASGIVTTPLAGKIIAVDTAVSATSRNLRYRALVSNPQGLLQAGIAVTVSVSQKEVMNALVVPAMAVRYEPAGTFIYVIHAVPAKADDAAKNAVNELRAEKRKVSVAAEVDGMVAIIDGVKAGEMVAVDGSFKLKDNMLVKLAKAEGKQP